MECLAMAHPSFRAARRTQPALVQLHGPDLYYTTTLVPDAPLLRGTLVLECGSWRRETDTSPQNDPLMAWAQSVTSSHKRREDRRMYRHRCWLAPRRQPANYVFTQDGVRAHVVLMTWEGTASGSPSLSSPPRRRREFLPRGKRRPVSMPQSRTERQLTRRSRRLS